MSLALAGVRILDLTWGVAGPLGVMMLADMGADVIKVEPPGGDPFRDAPGSPVWHRNRRSIILDLKTVEGKAIFHDLCDNADVLIESFAPGTMDALGLSYEVISKRHPSLIYSTLTAYPEGHRYAERPGWDALVQARSGVQNEQPAWRPGPAHLHFQVPSMGACFLLTSGVLAALIEREKSGLGQHFSTSLFQGAMAYTTQIWQDIPGLVPPASLIMAKSYPPGIHQLSIYECANGQWLHAGVNVGRKATQSMESILGVEDSDPMRMMRDPEYRAERIPAIREAFKKRDRAELLTLFFDAGIGADPINPGKDAYDYEQLQWNNMIVDIDDYEFGPMKQFGAPARFSKMDHQELEPRPRAGEHSREVLMQAGYSVDQIDSLFNQQVIA
jgi:crotonobetainyl-CoA:carnitine CoA-transferase CaiB-like acyl-CoA transferase